MQVLLSLILAIAGLCMCQSAINYIGNEDGVVFTASTGIDKNLYVPAGGFASISKGVQLNFTVNYDTTCETDHDTLTLYSTEYPSGPIVKVFSAALSPTNTSASGSITYAASMSSFLFVRDFQWHSTYCNFHADMEAKFI